jgi:hypothetical protein
MAITVFSEPLKRRFVSDVLSAACLLNFLILFGAAILPLYISWASTLWIREKYVTEQLDVSLTGQIIVQVQGTKSSVPFTGMWSTHAVANSLFGSDVLRAMTVRVTPADWNVDGIMDQAAVSVEIPLASDERVFSVTAVLFAQAQLHVSRPVGPARRTALTPPPPPPPPPPKTPGNKAPAAGVPGGGGGGPGGPAAGQLPALTWTVLSLSRRLAAACRG